MEVDRRSLSSTEWVFRQCACSTANRDFCLVSRLLICYMQQHMKASIQVSPSVAMNSDFVGLQYFEGGMGVALFRDEDTVTPWIVGCVQGIIYSWWECCADLLTGVPLRHGYIIRSKSGLYTQQSAVLLGNSRFCFCVRYVWGYLDALPKLAITLSCLGFSDFQQELL